MHLLDRSWQTSPQTWYETRLVCASVLNFSCFLTERFKWRRFKIGRNPPSFLGTVKYWHWNPDSTTWGGTTSMASFLKGVIIMFPYKSLLGTHQSRDNPGQSDSPDWPLVYLELLALCPEVEDWQGMADLAGPPRRLASLPVPLRFRAETEISTHRKPLHPETLAGLAERFPEGTDERRAPYNEVYTGGFCSGILLTPPPPPKL